MGEQKDIVDLQIAFLQHTAFFLLCVNSAFLQPRARVQFFGFTVHYLGMKGMGWEGSVVGKIVLVKIWGLTGEMKNK